MADPSADRLTGRLRNLKLYRTLGLLLQHDGPRCHAAPVADVTYAQLDQVAGSKLAVDGEVEQCQFAATVGELQAGPNRPYLFEFKRCLLTDELSLVPGFANGSGATFHGWLP